MLFRLGFTALGFGVFALAGCNDGSSPRSGTTSFVTAETLNTGTWSQTANPAPTAITGVFLLPDGTVMGQGPWISKNWFKLTPDSSGSYVHGSWSTLASMSLERLYYGSGVLPSGKIYIQGGEYSGLSGAWNMAGTGEIYDPVANSWSAMAPFPKGAFGDDPTAILPDGTILAGFFGDATSWLYNPTTNAWTQGPNKLYADRSDEETFVTLPDGSILTYDIFGGPSGHERSAQRYVPSLNQWVDAGVTPNQLEDDDYELGPAVRLPSNGKVLVIGALPYTALYTPPATLAGTGSWEAGPQIPYGAGANDAPAAVLPNGHVMFVAGASQVANTSTQIFDYDPTTNAIVVAETPPEMNLAAFAPYELRMLMLPSGELMITTGFDSRPWIFMPKNQDPDPSWKPSVQGIAENVDGTYTLSGTQLNGLDEGSSYGDDFENATNYPIVRITDNAGTVRYARTFNWSNTGVATGNAVVTTQFALPAGVAPGSGTYTLNVIANGIASDDTSFAP